MPRAKGAGKSPALAGGAGERGGDLREGRVGVGAQRLNRRQTHHDDQGQHHGVFNRRRAVFRFQKLLNLQCKRLHSELQNWIVIGKQ